MQFKLRTLFVLTAFVAIGSICFVPRQRSPLPHLTMQIVYSPDSSPDSRFPNNRAKELIDNVYATVLRRIVNEGNFDLESHSISMIDLRKIIRITLGNVDLNSTIMELSVWPSPALNDFEDLQEILETTRVVIQDTKSPETSIIQIEF